MHLVSYLREAIQICAYATRIFGVVLEIYMMHNLSRLLLFCVMITIYG